MDDQAARRLLQALIEYFEQGNRETDAAAKAILASDFENRDYWLSEMQRFRETGEWTGVRSMEAEFLSGILKQIQRMNGYSQGHSPPR